MSKVDGVSKSVTVMRLVGVLMDRQASGLGSAGASRAGRCLMRPSISLYMGQWIHLHRPAAEHIIIQTALEATVFMFQVRKAPDRCLGHHFNMTLK